MFSFCFSCLWSCCEPSLHRLHPLHPPFLLLLRPSKGWSTAGLYKSTMDKFNIEHKAVQTGKNFNLTVSFGLAGVQPPEQATQRLAWACRVSITVTGSQNQNPACPNLEWIWGLGHVESSSMSGMVEWAIHWTWLSAETIGKESRTAMPAGWQPLWVWKNEVDEVESVSGIRISFNATTFAAGETRIEDWPMAKNVCNCFYNLAWWDWMQRNQNTGMQVQIVNSKQAPWRSMG